MNKSLNSIHCKVNQIPVLKEMNKITVKMLRYFYTGMNKTGGLRCNETASITQVTKSLQTRTKSYAFYK